MLVYKQYDQESLDNQYNTRLQVPDYATYLHRWEMQSRQTAEQLPSSKNIRYGDLPREISDIYPSSKPGSKTLIFIHGGYWHLLDKSMFQFIADAFYPELITTVFLSYPQAPAVTMDQIVASCRKALSWCYKHISNYNGDPGEIYLLGHSAGGHLATMLLATDLSATDPAVPADFLKGVCSASGLFDLIPIQHSYVNQAVKMDESMAIRNSPVHLKPVHSCPLIVAVGEDESDEFQTQSRELHNAWNRNGFNAELLMLPGENHYSIIETAANKTAPLSHALKQLMKIQ